MEEQFRLRSSGDLTIAQGICCSAGADNRSTGEVQTVATEIHGDACGSTQLQRKVIRIATERRRTGVDGDIGSRAKCRRILACGQQANPVGVIGDQIGAIPQRTVVTDRIRKDANPRRPTHQGWSRVEDQIGNARPRCCCSETVAPDEQGTGKRTSQRVRSQGYPRSTILQGQNHMSVTGAALGHIQSPHIFRGESRTIPNDLKLRTGSEIDLLAVIEAVLARVIARGAVEQQSCQIASARGGRVISPDVDGSNREIHGTIHPLKAARPVEDLQVDRSGQLRVKHLFPRHQIALASS